ncbi:cysteine desulfurase NifS [Methanolobus halotolerans]|uniref:Cysteine desulfurase n=1 Tax=Methanolobus halotolerans TaxID=2052935 RepID=A0A4E0Q7Y9_9EURY|nr:cysteine desulfurase NifS [Methanolobus halotolerans]TGC11040.1 cysteine desulfurase NifS [Methanolobus halotolerans]
MKRIYMDHSATTEVDPLVLDSMLPYFTEKFGNASSLHSFGQEAIEALSAARQQVADSIGAKANEIIFTSGGTESDNLAIRGVLAKKKNDTSRSQHIITSMIEHPAVLSTCSFLESIGYEVTYVPVDSEGVLDLDKLERSVRDDTSIISIMHANNEIGTIQPVKDIARIARDKDVYFHTDAVQSFGKIPVDVNEMGVDMLSISSHKIHGPKGAGVLYVREGTELEPFIFGGGHEQGLRPGTENIPGIVGLGKAMSLAKERLGHDPEHMLRLRDSLIDRIFDSLDDVRLNGHPTQRLPNNVNLSFRYVEGESLLMLLDVKGIAISTASACSSISKKESHVLSSIGLNADYIHGTIRISLGKDNTIEETDHVVQSLQESVGKLREMSAISKS